MSEAKPFQKATVKQVMRAFNKTSGPRRFLVADEVGLGKTVVAQHVISELIKAKKEPLIVFYICSNLTIAKQNQDKLLEAIPGDEKEMDKARCPVDRLTPLPAADPPTHHQLHLYTLTPETSLPMRAGRRRDGRQEERALIHALVESAWPEFFSRKNIDFFKVNAGKWWNQLIERQRQKVTMDLKTLFIQAVRNEMGLEPRKWVIPALLNVEEPLELIARLRNALAVGAIEKLRPDLVIFDEFQRFRDLVSSNSEEAAEDEAAERLIRTIRGDQSPNPPALLLLSATPYRMFTHRWEDEAGAAHHSEFFELVKFLWGGNEFAEGKKTDCQKAFSEFERELRKRRPCSEEALKAREKIQTLLRPVMARTERASHHQGWAEMHTRNIPTELSAEDLKIFKHLSASFIEKHRSATVPYWTSIPFPMQTMGHRYKAWQEAIPVHFKGLPVISSSRSYQNQKSPLKKWPHPRLRALQEFMPAKQLALPWVSPSLPWWPLGGGWKHKGPEKILLFSRFIAVPQAVASLVSFDLERVLLADKGISYRDVTKRRLLTAAKNGLRILGLFYPSPWLVTATDPLMTKGSSLSEVRREMISQVREGLKRLGIAVREGGRSRPISHILGQIDHLAGNWNWVSEIVRKIPKQNDPERGLARLLDQWDEEAQQPLNCVTSKEVKRLAEYALGSPGVIVGRALSRHWKASVTAEGFQETWETSWNGVRTYLDQMLFVEILEGNENTYPKAILKAVAAGNLEAVLDEHFWIIRKIQNAQGPDLAKNLNEALIIKTGNHQLFNPDKSDPGGFTLRCHAAMPFLKATRATVEGEESERPLRTESLRKAFNSPFWPHILATTSIGQEGLDFHVWCGRVVHWDLCGNPVDLEQREGRIQRYGGISIRRTIARDLGPRIFGHLSKGKSPWHMLEQLAEDQWGDNSGLCPWWVCEGADIERFVFDLPTSEQTLRLQWVKEQRLLYRLVLGQPNQEDLLDILCRRVEMKPEDIRKAMIELSPWFQKVP